MKNQTVWSFSWGFLWRSKTFRHRHLLTLFNTGVWRIESVWCYSIIIQIIHCTYLTSLIWRKKNKKPPSFFLIFLKVCAPSSAVCSGLAKSADHHNYWINNVITAVTVPPWMLSDHDCRALSSAFSSLDTRCSSTKLLRFFRGDSGGFLSKILTVLWSTIKAASHSQYEHFAHIVRMKICHMWILGCVLARVWR